MGVNEPLTLYLVVPACSIDVTTRPVAGNIVAFSQRKRIGSSRNVKRRSKSAKVKRRGRMGRVFYKKHERSEVRKGIASIFLVVVLVVVVGDAEDVPVPSSIVDSLRRSLSNFDDGGCC